MCLLITQTKDTNFTDEHLRDFYDRNRDGIGVMWAEDGHLCYQKIIPASAQEAVDFYNRHARGKDCAVHYRMRTHGHIDMENCHPYEVFGFDASPAEMPMLLMHNGVLHTGNGADTGKSDTWHYIRVYLRRLLATDPTLAFTPEFQEIIGKHIGNNRFVLMNHLGQMSVINKQQGVEFNGAWLSNEYAWSAHKYLPRRHHYDTWGHWNPVTKRFEQGSEVPTTKKSTAPHAGGSLALTAPTGKKNKKKHAQRSLFRTMNTGGETPTTAAKITNERHGVSVDCKCLDDVLEIRSMLDAFYVDNSTTNKQIECLLETIGVTKAYFAVELLGDGLISERMWDTITTNRTEAKYFASQPAENFRAPRMITH